MAQQQCNGTNKLGEPCGGKALPGSEFCIAHDPAKIVAITEARRKGGAARSNRAKARRELEGAAMTASEINGTLAIAIRRVMSDRMTPGVASALAALSRAALEAGKASDLEQRLDEIERRLGSKAS